MKSIIKVTAVDFDTDGNQKLSKRLAEQYVGSSHDIEHLPDEDPLDFLADKISNDSGWCVFSVDGEVLEVN